MAVRVRRVESLLKGWWARAEEVFGGDKVCRWSVVGRRRFEKGANCGVARDEDVLAD